MGFRSGRTWTWASSSFSRRFSCEGRERRGCGSTPPSGAEDLVPVRRDDGRLAYRVAVTFAALGEDDELVRVDRTLDLLPERTPREGEAIPVRLRAELPAGSYDLTFVLRDAEAERVGNYAREPLTVRDLRGNVPLLSDLVVAADSGGTWSPGGDVYLRAHPTHETGADGVAFVYYEAYNLTSGGPYDTRVRLEPMDGGEAAFDLSYPGEAVAGASIATRGVLRLDFSETEPGDYRMSVTVLDRTTGRRTLPSVTTIRVDRP